MKKLTMVLLSAACVLGLSSVGLAHPPCIYEILMNDISADNVEFVEIRSEPNKDLTGFTFIQIEGDENSSSRGRVLSAIDPHGLDQRARPLHRR